MAARKAALEHRNMPSAAEVALGNTARPLKEVLEASSKTADGLPPVSGKWNSVEEACKADFRVFLTLIWRHLLGVDPSPIQLDMAYYLQHGPSRTIIMAFRGFSKSWITGAYALWRLYCDPNEQILIVSGSMARAVATTNWALMLILSMPLLAHMKPKPHYRQSALKFDVGSCENPGQSASFSAFGIGGQLVGFRGTCIIPDDVETQTNSLTVVMREKIEEAVKEFESVLTPGGVIKYLGTPHDTDSLYLKLLRLKDKHGRPVYEARIWPALFPTEEEIKSYGIHLAPYITAQLRKYGPSIVGHSTMPNRFTDDDLEKRRAAMGNTEFRLQFMLDLRGIAGKFPLKLRDLMVLPLDDARGPVDVTWGNRHVLTDLPVMGEDGDFYHGPLDYSTQTARWQKVIGYVDSSGRGEDETSLCIVALLHGRVFWLHLWASKDGYGPGTLEAISQACVRFGVHELYVESNFGDGVFLALLRPVLQKAWEKHVKLRTAAGQMRPDDPSGSKLEEVKVGKVGKETRILSVIEPITQSHRLVVSKSVIEWDNQSINEMEGEETRHRYAWGYQYTHLTRDRDCLGHDDRLDSLAGALGIFAPELGVDPKGMSVQYAEDEKEDWLMKLMLEDEEAVGRPSSRGPQPGSKDGRMIAATPTAR